MGWALALLALAGLPGCGAGDLEDAGWQRSAASVPRTATRPPRPPWQPAQPASAAVSPSTLSAELGLPPLKAVLIVGPIDGPTGTWTSQEKQNMDLAAAELSANGVSGHKFYAPGDDWQQIAAAAEGAHFLLYRGHGVAWSAGSTPVVGGFALSKGAVSSEQIRSDLAPAPNAVVMLYGCFTAGTSSSDTTSISSAEAQRRVAQYSDPFFDIGAAGYFANWFGDAFQMFVRYLYQGKTLRQSYESYFDFNPATVERYTHPLHPGLALHLDKDYWDGKTQYNNALAGLPDRTLGQLFCPAMRVSPTSLFYLAQSNFPSRAYSVRVTSTTAQSFTWSATVEPAVSWLSLSKTQGSSGQSFLLSLEPAGLPKGTHQAGVRLVASGSTCVADADCPLTPTSMVVYKVYTTYLPVVQK
jgi:hypothetical protein